MEFRILGPLEVTDGNTPLTLGSPRHRILLATLLVHSGEVVPTDRLIETLWGRNAPRSAAEMLHVRVSELRKFLRAGETACPARIVTSRPGYLLHVAAGELDAHRFEQLALAGRDALGNGDPLSASTHLGAALALWRGPALLEIADRSIAQAEVARLDDLRLQVHEDRLHAELALGRHLEVIGESESLVAEHPLREHLWCQLMLALYRAGRQAEALHVYRKACGCLVDELGIDPGEELRQLHLAILRQDPALRPTNPPLVARRRTPNNLPVRVTSFVGRQDDSAEIRALLKTARLVTLTGVGGSGKSRLALEVAAADLDIHPDGVWIVELAVLNDPQLVVSTTAAVLGVREQPGREQLDLVLDHLRPARALLVLDNCEHLIDEVAKVVTRLLDACPHLRVLCTSRELLGIPGEILRSMSGLSLPAAGATNASQVRDADAVRLFTERATAVQADFLLSDTTAKDVAEICGRLDGLPLAIELAAARITAFGVGQIAARLDDRFRLLARSSRIAAPRHQTLHAVVNWSYDLLNEPERRLFDHLSIFLGSFTVEAAEAICAPSDVNILADLLGRLVDKSLLIADTTVTREYRYRMLETLHEFGMQKLDRRGQVEQVRTRHARYFRALGEAAAHAVRGAEQRVYLARLGAEHTNFRAALEFSLKQGDVETAARLAGSLYQFWDLRGHYAEGRQWLSRVLASDRKISVAARTRALMGAATLAVIQGDLERAIASCEEATVLSWQFGDSAGIAHALQYLGFMAICTEDLDRASALLHESLDLARTAGADWEHAWALVFLTGLALTKMEYDEAFEFTLRSQAALETIGDPEALTWTLILRAAADWGRQRTDQAAEALHAGIRAFDDLGGLWGLSVGLLVAAMIAAARGRLEAAARLLGASEHLRESIGVALLPFTRLWLDNVVAETTTALGPEVFLREWRTGQMLSRDAALREALSAVSLSDPAPSPR